MAAISTADVVKFNFDRMLKDDHPYHDTGPFPLSFFFSAVENVEAIDPQTVKFTLNAPYAPFLSNLAYPTGLIVSQAARRTARRRVRPQSIRHRAVQIRRMALERGCGGGKEPRLLGRRANA